MVGSAALPHQRAELVSLGEQAQQAAIRRREHKMRGFRSPGSAPRFLAAHAGVANAFTTPRHLISAATHRQFRSEAFATWHEAAELAA